MTHDFRDRAGQKLEAYLKVKAEMTDALIAAYITNHGSCARVEQAIPGGTETWLVPCGIDEGQLEQIMNVSGSIEALSNRYSELTSIPPSEVSLVDRGFKVYYQKRSQ